MATCSDVKEVYMEIGSALTELTKSREAGYRILEARQLDCPDLSASTDVMATREVHAKLSWPVRNGDLPEAIEWTSHTDTHHKSIVLRYKPDGPETIVQSPAEGRLTSCTKDVIDPEYPERDIYEITILTNLGDRYRMGNMIDLEPRVERLCELALAGNLRTAKFTEQIFTNGESLARLVRTSPGYLRLGAIPRESISREWQNPCPLFEPAFPKCDNIQPAQPAID